MNKLLKESILWILIAIPYLYLAAIWNDLPAKVPTHFGINGEVNGWSDKYVLLFIPAAMCVSTYLIMFIVPGIDPKKRIEEMGNKYFTLRLILSLFMTVLSIYLLYLGKEGSMKNPNILFALLGGFFAIMGNYFQTVRPNYFVGIRTPWTLESDLVWKKTHTLCGRVWMAGGLLIVIIAFAIPGNTIKFISFISLISLMVLVPVVYSYLEYKKEKKLIKQ